MNSLLLKKAKNIFIYREEIFAKKKVFPLSRKSSECDFCIVLEGTVLIEIIDESGSRRILDFFSDGDIFCTKIFDIPASSGCYIVSTVKSRIAFLTEKTLQKKDDIADALAFIREVYFNMHSQALAHIYILEQNSIRNKLLAFMKYQSKRRNKNPFYIYMSLTNCADYLSIDRSAMMRELKLLEADKLLMHKGKMFKLLQ